jgi:hypothetical protein
MQKMLALLGSAALITVMSVTSAEAQIELKTGIAGVNVGMSPDQVVNQVGKPKETVKKPQSGNVNWLYGKKGKKLRVTMSGDTVFAVSTAKPKQRTSAGVGVGSTKKQVLKLVPGAYCNKLGKGRFMCRDAQPVNGSILTAFQLSENRVYQVAVSKIEGA